MPRIAGHLRRGLPVAAFFLLAAVVIANVDTPRTETASAGTGAIADGSSPSATPGASTPETGAPADRSQSAAAGGSAATGGGETTAPGEPGAPTPDGDGGPVSSIGTGISVAGVDCTTGARQLAVSAYGALCQAASDGTNPGATARGVTGDTINVTFRISDSGQSAALLATAGTAADSLGGNQNEVAADMQKLVDHLNGIYDLYGRQVRLRVFRGQGDFLAEFQNQNIQGAQSDAARARDQDAFLDASIVTMTQPYSEALAAQGIIGLSPVYLSSRWYDEHAPYAFGTLWPSSSALGEFMGNTVCQRMTGPTTFAGSGLEDKPRVIGIIHPENPEFTRAADEIDRAIRACGKPPARRIGYALNIATAQNEHSNAVAQFKAAGVTTVLCVCDEFSPIFLTRAADQQQYRPEWFQLWWPDPWQRLASSNQWKNSIHTAGATPDFMAGEVGQVWRAAAGSAQPQAPDAVNLVHQQLVTMFSALQAAGPNLTPQTFEAGWFSLPSTNDGDFGPWQFGLGVRFAKSQFRLGWYDPDGRSAFDGKTGAIRTCSDGRYVRFDDPGSLSGSLGCFGR